MTLGSNGGFVMIVNLTNGGEVQLWNGSSGRVIWFFHAGSADSSLAQTTRERMDGWHRARAHRMAKEDDPFR